MSSAYKMLESGENLTVSYAMFDTMLNMLSYLDWTFGQ